jgi:CheY-like chemotaxis protein/nitrogen-specific signal transduction histidine kinase
VIEVEMSGHPLDWEGHPARLVMAIDVTERHRLEQELRSARAVEAVGRLAGGIAHDFNNLVMAINGFAEILLERLPPETDEHDAAVEIRTAGLRAAALTSQLLAFARPHEPRPLEFDLNELVEGMADTIRSISGPNVRVGIEATAPRASIVADRDQIARAIVGCVLNARDAMPDGGELRVETSDVDSQLARQLTGVSGDRSFVGLAISDSGPTGLSPSIHGSPDEPLQARTGLGLALVYSTIQLAGGRIRLESTPGRGSTVRILLPIVADGATDAALTIRSSAARPADPAPEADGSDAIDVTQPELAAAFVGLDRQRPVADGGAEARGPAVIAVVEDEPGVRSLVERLLQRGGHHVLTFPDGASAIDALADPAVTIDLLITDLVMPGPNGIEVARRIRRDRPTLPVVLMSGFAADALHAEGIDEASVELLAKPFSAADLLGRVAALLAGKPVSES